MKYRSFKSCPKHSTNIQSCWYHTFPQRNHRKSVILFSHSFILFLPLYYHLQDFVFELMNIKGWTIFQKNSTGTSYIHEIQNTTEISHSLVHYTRLFNHDKLLYLQIHKNYSIIHIILNQNKSCQHKCQLKVTNLVKFWPIKNVFGSVVKNSLIFFYKKFSWFDFSFEDVMWNFNQGKLLTRKTSNGTKHLVEIPIFKLPHHQRVF